MRKVTYLLIAAVLLLSIFPSPMRAFPPINDVAEVASADSPIEGTGSMASVRIGAVQSGVIFGDENESAGVYLYMKGPRSTAICESRDSGRITGQALKSSDETLFFGIYRIIEFRDINNNSRLEATSTGYDYHLTGYDVPVSGLSMNLTWVESHAMKTLDDRNLSFTVRLKVKNPREDLIWNDYSGRMEAYSGTRTAAASISLTFTINMSYYPTREKIPVYACGGNSSLRDEDWVGRSVQISADMSYSIERWKYRYPDSKILVQFVTGIYGEKRIPEGVAGREHINMTSSSPRYLNVYEDTVIDKQRDIYGRQERIWVGNRKVGDIRGGTHAISDGGNESYILRLMGKRNGSGALPHPSGEGFSLITSTAYKQANLTVSSWYIGTQYFLPDGIERENATPGWLVSALLMESGAISVAAVWFSYKRYMR